jgi:hypothetical protein
VLNHVWGNDSSYTFGPWPMRGMVVFQLFDIDLLDIAIGRADVQGSLYVTVRHSDMKVTNIKIVDGVLTDLYDFDYNDAGLARMAAIVQAGYNTLGVGGHIYKIAVSLDTETYLPFAFTYAPG